MPQKLGDVVRFRADRLFNGAVSIDWFTTNQAKALVASEAFVFHGPQYHGVQQADVGTAHGHKLVDTASFVRTVVRCAYGHEEQPFTLAIAGYGTGKSHLGLTIATLLADPDGSAARSVVAALGVADEGIAKETRAVLAETSQPCLVIALNGMQNFDLAAEITRQLAAQLRARGLSTRALDELRPRFAQAAGLVRMANDSIQRELLSFCQRESSEDLIEKLGGHDEDVYGRVYEFFRSRGVTIRSLTGESIRDILNSVIDEYCGVGKAYRSLVILFDEFGRYTEFATVRSQIAGSGVLQDLFEAVQANTGNACFVGFIQFELDAYVQRVGAEHRNEIRRYVTRYQIAQRFYLSINLETLLASLLEKQDRGAIDRRLDNAECRKESQQLLAYLSHWFREVRNHRLWSDPEQFHTVVRKGCWPLSPFSTWFLFYLASAGKHLQERSVLALLAQALAQWEGRALSEEADWALAPVDLWSDALQEELLSSEESGQQGAVVHAYAAVAARHGAKMSEDLHRVLRAVVVASKMGLQADDRRDAVRGLAQLAGLPLRTVEQAVAHLQDEYNVLGWDEAFKEFDILGDAVPRTQFLAFVRQRVASTYDEAAKAKLFAGRAREWCGLHCNVDCDFAEKNAITTREWRWQGVPCSLDMLPTQIKVTAERWSESFGVDEPRGTVIYCYLEPSRDPGKAAAQAKRALQEAAHGLGVAAVPILVVFLYDETGQLGQALAEMEVLEHAVGEEEKVRFGNLLPAHREKTLQIIENEVGQLVRQRRYVTGLAKELDATRLDIACSNLFKSIYYKALPFPFDGFATARGNAADTCYEFTAELMAGKLDYESLIAKPVKAKNRGITVLKESWGVFTKGGTVSKFPSHPVLREITERWEHELADGKRSLEPWQAIRDLCYPPYGANIASAGLFLGVFVAARYDNLVAVREDEKLSVGQWVQDGIFKGKFIDLKGLQGVYLTAVAESSTEWESLLDEWEQAESHSARVRFHERSVELKKRIGPPPDLRYRLIHLEEESTQSKAAIADMDGRRNAAIGKLGEGCERQDAAVMLEGGVELADLIERMVSAKPLWTDHEIAELQPHLERAKQEIVQLFPCWVQQQVPANDSPEAVGEFRHEMLKIVGTNLKRLGLASLYETLETHTTRVVRNAQTAADARQLLRDVQSWLQMNADACRIIRVAELRGLVATGKEFVAKLQAMSRRIELAELSDTRHRLAEFIVQIGKEERKATERGGRLWTSKLESFDDLESLRNECDSLVPVFEGCQTDLEDLRLLRRVLESYESAFKQLGQERLTWDEFDALAAKLRTEAEASFGEEEIPWPIEETYDCFVGQMRARRVQLSAAWVSGVEAQAERIPGMPAAEASRLHDAVRSPPGYVTTADLARLERVAARLEGRLNALAVEWLFEKFCELPVAAKREFLRRIGGVRLDS